MTIVAGLINQTFYYSYFDIPIKYYLNLSEIPVLIATDFLIFFLPAVLFIGFWYHEWHQLHQSQKQDKKMSELRSFNKWLKYITTALLIIISLFLISKLIINKHYYILNLVLILLLVSILYSLNRKKLIKYFSSLIQLFVAEVFVIFIVIILIVSIDRILSFKENKPIYIQTHDNRFLATDTVQLIGKTADYYFLYKTNTDSVIILPKEEVKSVSVKKKLSILKKQ